MLPQTPRFSPLSPPSQHSRFSEVRTSLPSTVLVALSAKSVLPLNWLAFDRSWRRQSVKPGSANLPPIILCLNAHLQECVRLRMVVMCDCKFPEYRLLLPSVPHLREQAWHNVDRSKRCHGFGYRDQQFCLSTRARSPILLNR